MPHFRGTLVGGLLLMSAGQAGLAWHGPQAASASNGSACRPKVRLITHGFGSPDDLALMNGVVFFGDTSSGVVASIDGRHAKIRATGFRTPEGLAAWGDHRLLVVEQGLNRLDLVNLRKGTRRVFLRVRNNTGREGVDSIAVIQPYRGGKAIADETADAVWLLKAGRVKRLATVPTPDDVVTSNGMLLAVTLGDGALWEIRPKLRRLVAGLMQPQGLVSTGSGSVDVATSRDNAIYSVAIPAVCGS